MRPNPPTNNLPHMPIRIKKVHTPPTPIPIHSRMDMHLILFEIRLPPQHLLLLLHRKRIMQLQRNLRMILRSLIGQTQRFNDVLIGAVSCYLSGPW